MFGVCAYVCPALAEPVGQAKGMIRRDGLTAPDGLSASQDNITGSTQLLKMTHAYMLAFHAYQWRELGGWLG